MSKAISKARSIKSRSRRNNYLFNNHRKGQRQALSGTNVILTLSGIAGRRLPKLARESSGSGLHIVETVVKATLSLFDKPGTVWLFLRSGM